ncbi:hypothetical protein C8J56DRAFT_1131821 [Mycena floridula]|nr:hypothetical protein C8J56DRAFT_1131821 [Mycena floridula]
MSEAMQPGPLADSNIFALQESLMRIAVEFALQGICSALAIIVLYKLLTNKAQLSAHRILIAAVISMSVASTIQISLDLACYLIQLPTLGFDPSNVERSLINMSILSDIMIRLNYLIGDSIVVWRACVLWTNYPRIHMLLYICLFGTFAYKVWNMAREYQVQIRQNLFLSKNRRTKVERVLILLTESGSIYCLLWVAVLVIDLKSSNDQSLSYVLISSIIPSLVISQAIYPIIIVLLVALEKDNLESTVNDQSFLQSLQFASRPQVPTVTQSDDVTPDSTTSHIDSVMPDPATDDRLDPTMDNGPDSKTNDIAVAEPLEEKMEKRGSSHFG